MPAKSFSGDGACKLVKYFVPLVILWRADPFWGNL